MKIIAILEFRLKPELLDDGRAVVHRILDETRARPGCESVDVMIDKRDAAHLIIVERWASPEADAAYREFRAGPGAPTDLGDYLAGPPAMTKGVLDPAV